MSQTQITVGIIQHQVSINASRESIQADLSKTISQLAKQGAQLIVLPELHDSLYFCQQEIIDNFALAQPIDGATTTYLRQLAKQHRCVIVGSIFEKRARGLYHNTAVVLDIDGSIAGIYRKMHIPDDPGFYEKYYFTPGDLGFTPINTSLGKLGVLVCWDQWYPEAARVMALQGAEILIYPTAIGWDQNDDKAEQQRQLHAWQTIQQSHAIANGLPVISANRVGHEACPIQQTTGILFWGNSFVCGQQGDMLACASTEKIQTIVTDVALTRTDRIREIWPFLRDRRIDAYGDLLQRYCDDG